MLLSRYSCLSIINICFPKMYHMRMFRSSHSARSWQYFSGTRMPCISAVLVCRPGASGRLVTVASSSTEDNQATPGNSSDAEISLALPTDEELCRILESGIRVHFTNHGRLEVDGLSLHYSVLCAEPCTLVYAVLAAPEVNADRTQYFLTQVQGAILSEAQLLMLMPQSGERELQPHIQPMLLQLMMAENNAQNPQNKKMEDLRAQVDSVKTIMTDNVERILERGERLDNMQQRTEDLAASSANFKMNARRVQRKMCMLNAKWTIIAVIATIIGLTIIILIILSAAGVFKKN